MTSQDFMKILIAQLRQQDPMNPMSNEAMIQQMATIRDMEMSYTLTEALNKMTSEQRFAGAAGLIGKYVVGTVEDADGEEITLEGVVTGVRFTSTGKAVLELDTGESLPLEKLTEVHGTVLYWDDSGDPTGQETSVAKGVRQARPILGQTSGLTSLKGLATFGMQNRDGSGINVTLG